MPQFQFKPKSPLEAFIFLSVARTCGLCGTAADDTITQAVDKYTRQYPVIVFWVNEERDGRKSITAAGNCELRDGCGDQVNLQTALKTVIDVFHTPSRVVVDLGSNSMDYAVVTKNTVKLFGHELPINIIDKLTEAAKQVRQ